MIIYRGSRLNGRLQVYREDGCKSEPLKHVVLHSPTGFEAGYGGSGPADLALSLLWDCLGEEMARVSYQDFKWIIVARLPHDTWVLTELDIQEVVRAIKENAL